MANTNEIWDQGRRLFTGYLTLDTIENWMQDKPTTRAYFDTLRARLQESDDEDLLAEARGAAYELARAIKNELGRDMSFVYIEDAARIYTGLE